MKESYFEIYQAESRETPSKIAAYRVRKFIANLEELGVAEKIRELIKSADKNQNPQEQLWQINKETDIPHDSGFDLIKADVYKAMISRNNAIHSRDRTKSDNETFNGMAHQLNEKTIREQMDKICYNVMLLQANRLVVDYQHFEYCKLRDEAGFCMHDEISKIFQDEGLMPGFDSQYAKDFMTCLQILYVQKEYFSINSCRSRIDILNDRDYYSRLVGLKGGYVIATDSDTTLENNLRKIPYDADSDQLVMAISKIIDMTHYRGPLAAAFVEGGADTCKAVSNMEKDEIHESYAAYIANTFKRLLQS